MYSQSHRHIHLLSDQEVEDIYAATQFNSGELTLYFSLFVISHDHTSFGRVASSSGLTASR